MLWPEPGGLAARETKREADHKGEVLRVGSRHQGRIERQPRPAQQATRWNVLLGAGRCSDQRGQWLLGDSRTQGLVAGQKGKADALFGDHEQPFINLQVVVSI